MVLVVDLKWRSMDIFLFVLEWHLSTTSIPMSNIWTLSHLPDYCWFIFINYYDQLTDQHFEQKF